jgi:hypothetical protein
MKGGSPAYAYHQVEGLLSQTTNVEHVKPLTQYESSNHDNYSNLYKVSGGGRRRRKRTSLRKHAKRSFGSSNKHNRRKSKRRLSRKNRGSKK